MRVFLGFRHAQVAQLVLRHHIGENIPERVRSHYVRQSELLVILRHACVLEPLGNTLPRYGRIQYLRVGEVTTTLGGQTTLPRQAAGNLAGAVGAEIKVDDGIFIADGRNRAASVVHADKRNNKFVRHATIVGFFCSLNGINKLAPFSLTANHGVKGF